MLKTVIIDCFPESVQRYASGYGVVAVDVIRATTTTISAAATGRRCFAAPSLDSAFQAAALLDNPLLCGESAGLMPAGFDLNNSPSEIAARRDVHRPLVLLSSSGTLLLHAASRCEAAYPACFRNYAAVAARIAGVHSRIALIGAGSRREFRVEDQMCCASIAQQLMDSGYAPADSRTSKIVARWRNVPPEACTEFKSAAYLRRSGQMRDLEFIVERMNDLDVVFTVKPGEALPATEVLPNGAR